MSKFLPVRDLPTGVMQIEENVRFTPTEDVVKRYVDVRGGWEFEVKKADGSWTDKAKNTVTTCASGPAILLYDPDAQIVGVTREFRFPAFLRDIADAKAGAALNRPAGRVLGLAMGAKEAAETMQTAAERETLEETGNSADYLWSGPVVYANQAISSDKLGLFVAKFDSTKATHNAEAGLKEEGELINFIMMPVQEFYDNALSGQFDTIGMAVAFVFQNKRTEIENTWAANSSASPQATRQMVISP